MFPDYSYPKQVIAGLAHDALLRHRRDFGADGRVCLRRLHPGLRLLGREYIPQHGPYVITPNHYCRPGYASQWTALAISASVPAKIHWVMTGELTFPGKWYAPFARPIFRFALNRIAQAYGFTPMPPMPPRPQDVQARAAAVRSLLRYVKRNDDPVIGLAPEGGDQPGGRLCMPPAGAGRLSLLLAATGMRFLPVGAYECGGELTLHFGEPYDLPLVQGTVREKDQTAGYTVMQHIAVLLPTELRGEFY